VREPVAVSARDSDATEAFGARLARTLPDVSGTPAVLFLQGDLGSGKTTLARGFLRALGITDTIRSPTYTLLERYDTQAATVVHLDLYRLRSAAELEALGAAELHRAGHVWLVEWPERGEGRLPEPDAVVELRAGPRSHEIQLVARSLLGDAWVRHLLRG
jgi:tRNA threonylcarbamoyladenosine biosynthesis protein TsaE